MQRRLLRPSLAVTILGCGALLLGGCSGGGTSEQTTTTEQPASQYGSSMGTQSADVTDVAALGDGPADGTTWEIPVGVSICGRFVDVPAGGTVDGVTAGPAATTVVGGASDESPTLRDFAESAGIGLAAGRLSMPDGIQPAELDNTDPPTPLAGATFATGDMCGDTEGEVQVWVYSADARTTGNGIMVVTQDLANVPFSEEGMAVVVAFAPESSLPTLPPSAFGN